MLEWNNYAANRRIAAVSAVTGALCFALLGSGLGCSADSDASGSAGAAGTRSTMAGSPGSAGTSAAGSSSGTTGGSSGVVGGANGGVGASLAGAAGAGAPPLGSAGAPAGGNGSSAGGGGAGATAGAGSTGGGCTRELLKAAVDSYFKALAAHDPSTLPLADTIKFTENGKESKPADAPLWKTAGTLKYAHSALDTETCNSATEAVVPDGATDIPIAVRLKLVNQKITEIETIAARKGDYTGVTSNTAALAASKDTIKWEDSVPAAMRNTREELINWMAKYFKQFPQGVCNTTSTCKRMENGGGNFVCSEGAGCAASSTSTVLKSHLIIADAETGLGVGFTLFTGGHPDMHMFKMYGGQVYAVSAILSKGDTTGWD